MRGPARGTAAAFLVLVRPVAPVRSGRPARFRIGLVRVRGAGTPPARPAPARRQRPSPVMAPRRGRARRLAAARPAPWSGTGTSRPGASGRGRVEDRHRGAGDNRRRGGRHHRRATPPEQFRLTAGRDVGTGHGGHAARPPTDPGDRQPMNMPGHPRPAGSRRLSHAAMANGDGRASAWPPDTWTSSPTSGHQTYLTDPAGDEHQHPGRPHAAYLPEHGEGSRVHRGVGRYHGFPGYQRVGLRR